MGSAWNGPGLSWDSLAWVGIGLNWHRPEMGWTWIEMGLKWDNLAWVGTGLSWHRPELARPEMALAWSGIVRPEMGQAWIGTGLNWDMLAWDGMGLSWDRPELGWPGLSWAGPELAGLSCRAWVRPAWVRGKPKNIWSIEHILLSKRLDFQAKSQSKKRQTERQNDSFNKI